MTILLIKTKDNKVYKDNASLHCLMLEKFGIKPNNVKNTGFITKNKEIWLNKKPD